MSWLRRLKEFAVGLIWLAVASGMAIAVSYYSEDITSYLQDWGISSGTLVLFLILAAAIAWLHNKSKTRLGDEELPHRGWMKQIKHPFGEGKPIEPKYGVSEGLPEKGLFIDEHDHAFFNDFASFGRVINKWLAEEEGPWRLQEDAKTEIGELGDDHPVYGRSYRIFYNQQEVGSLRIRPGIDYSQANPAIIGKGEIQFARLISFYRINELYDTLTHHLVDDPSHRTNFLYSLMYAVWENGPHTIKQPDLELHFHGNASTYLRILEHARQKRERSSV
jgi:hypothetical protein